MKKILLILTLLISQVTYSQQILNLNINEIRGNDTTQGGCTDYFNQFVRTTGVVHSNNFRQTQNSILYALIDNRADTLLSNRCGISIFKRNQNLPVTINQGDSIVVIGKDTCFNGLSQIIIDSVRILKTGAQLIQPRSMFTLNEISESYLVKLKNVEFQDWNDAPAPGATGFTATAVRGLPPNQQIFDIRIDDDCDLFGQPKPLGKVDIVGIGSQFDPTIPRDSRYQLLPRSSSDITPSLPLELPVINFASNVYTFDENSTYAIQINSSAPVQNQISCLIENQNITTDSSDYQLVTNVATFPAGLSSTTFGLIIPQDSIDEGIETFTLKLKKISNDYTIGNDSIATINISGTLSVKKIVAQNYVYFSNNELKSNFPSNFIGKLYIYDSFGKLVLSSENDRINQDIQNLRNYCSCIYRVVIYKDKMKIVTTLAK